MSGFEADVIDRLGRIETMLETDHRAINGNGHPGLLERVSTLEQIVSNNEENVAKLNTLEQNLMDVSKSLAVMAAKKAGVNEFIAGTLALISLVSSAVAIFSMFHK